ncbi:type II toxin-antitoxin system RelE/ParE family toxin [Sphingomonas sp. LR60]|uniref:type II toxin-antitoxin system RelE/ParE family toxin n=1 Tax=Sphingomonas sp. LR60 TaxID=3050233 RepID=UPI002FE0EEE1
MQKFGREQAERYADQLDRAFVFLGDHPRAGRQRPELRANVRSYPTGSHLILYTVDPDDNVLILRIRHGREDWLAD